MLEGWLTGVGRGRGRHYARRRALWEAALRLLYAGDWPARAWARWPGATRVRVVRHALRLPLRAPLRVAFASDLHLGPTTPDALLDRAFARLEEAAPDVLLLGGDYVFLDATAARARRLGELVRAVPARTKLAVLGNHDLWTRHDRLERALGHAGAEVLVNRAVRLPPPHHEVALVGLDDPWTGAPDAARALAGAAGARVILGLAHAPDAVLLLAAHTPRVDLLFCGHTHGGQIALPGGRALVVPGRAGKRWPWGLHATPGGGRLFVSRGLGGIELPVRTWAPPDVAVFDLLPHG